MAFPPERIVIVGAGGGIGSALHRACEMRYPGAQIHTFSRDSNPGLNFDHPDSIEQAAASVEGTIDLLLIASGHLHDEVHSPEKNLQMLSADAMTRSYQINTIGPAMVLRSFLRKMNREGKSVAAALSARVGSISDNRLGGWYSYRAAKAALNQVIKTSAIEHGRRYADSIIVGLHPGTVDSELSRPFQKNVPEGKLFSPEFSANALLDVIEGLQPDQSGQIFAWDGSVVPA